MRQKKGIYFAVAIFLIISSLIYIETQLPFFERYLPVEDNKLIVVVLNINLLLILLLLFLITRTLLKAYLERKRGIWGSGLKTRLTITLLIISIVPSFTLYMLATGFFKVSMDKWFGERIEEVVDDAFYLSSFYYDHLFQRYETIAASLAETIEKRGLLEKEGALNAYLKREAKAKLIRYYSVHDLKGDLLIGNIKGDILEGLSKRVGSVAKEGRIREIIPLKEGEVIISGIKINGEAQGGQTAAILFVGDSINIHGTARMQKILATQKGFKESMGFKRILKYSFYIPLSLITILTIFFSVWIGIKLATEITVPIEQVKEGASIIAKGKFDINLEEKGKDEIGTLVSAFNTMARELKFAKEELEAKNRYMEIILDNVATGIISADKRGNILIMNRAARHILGIDGDKVPSLKELMGTEFKAHMRSFIKEARSNKDGSVTKDIRLNLKKDVKYIRVSMTLLKDEQQKIEGFIIAFDDITYIIRAERLATWREVAKRLTHEIKNPLTPIRLSAERIRRRLPTYGSGVDRELIDETTSVIIRSVDDIKGIVNELTRFTHTAQTKNIEDINAIVEETINIYKNLYHNITFIFDSESIPSFRLDRDGIKRVLINLITNSAKAIDKMDGSIVVRTTYEEEKGIGRIEVSDNGIGIPDEDKARVFDPYFTKDPHGTGLGLTIVHSIILEHNGKIRLEDNLPRGTRVIIELPIIEG